MNTKKFNEFLRSKGATSIFALASLAGAFIFLNKSLTGMSVSENSTSLSLLTIIGLLLIACSVILGVYSIRKK